MKIFEILKKDISFQRKFLLGLSGMIFGIIITYIYYPKQPYRIGFIDTPSIFERIVVYKLINPEKAGIQKGKIYVFPLEKNTKYYKKGTMFIKYAECLPGNTLNVKGLKYYCNGKYFATAQKTDSKGIPVKHFVYNGVIPKGKVFMYAPHPRSYDSRYWGFLDESDIKGVVVWKVLKWGGENENR